MDLGVVTRVMGILNITPDSFSDGGDFFSQKDAIARGERLFEEGADILDIGGESTRPFSENVSAVEEIRRVVPVIAALARRVPVPLSIDTTKSEVARAALDAGASILNDISALRMDPEMAALAAATGAPVVLMHMKGTPKTMQLSPAYADLMGELCAFFQDRIAYATANGVERSRIVIDPGIGFGKTVVHNFQILQQLRALEKFDVPILIGPSRKAFIRKTLGDTDLSPKAVQVETGSQAAVAAAVLNGAHIVRVHNVANTRATLRIIDAVRNAG